MKCALPIQCVRRMCWDHRPEPSHLAQTFVFEEIFLHDSFTRQLYGALFCRVYILQGKQNLGESLLVVCKWVYICMRVWAQECRCLW